MYLYPITIKPEHQSVHYEQTVEINDNALTLAALAFVGTDTFSIQCGDSIHDAPYTVSVSRTRLETDEERDLRVARETSYMDEYRRRHPTT